MDHLVTWTDHICDSKPLHLLTLVCVVAVHSKISLEIQSIQNDFIGYSVAVLDLHMI